MGLRSVFFDAAVFRERLGFVLREHDDRAVLGSGEIRGLHDALVEAAEVREPWCRTGRSGRRWRTM